MKEKIFSKKKLLGFSPELHWDMMLLFFCFVLIGVSIYFSYLYPFCFKIKSGSHKKAVCISKLPLSIMFV